MEESRSNRFLAEDAWKRFLREVLQTLNDNRKFRVRYLYLLLHSPLISATVNLNLVCPPTQPTTLLFISTTLSPDVERSEAGLRLSQASFPGEANANEQLEGHISLHYGSTRYIRLNAKPSALVTVVSCFPRSCVPAWFVVSKKLRFLPDAREFPDASVASEVGPVLLLYASLDWKWDELMDKLLENFPALKLANFDICASDMLRSRPIKGLVTLGDVVGEENWEPIAYALLPKREAKVRIQTQTQTQSLTETQTQTQMQPLKKHKSKLPRRAPFVPFASEGSPQVAHEPLSFSFPDPLLSPLPSASPPDPSTTSTFTSITFPVTETPNGRREKEKPEHWNLPRKRKAESKSKSKSGEDEEDKEDREEPGQEKQEQDPKQDPRVEEIMAHNGQEQPAGPQQLWSVKVKMICVELQVGDQVFWLSVNPLELTDNLIKWISNRLSQAPEKFELRLGTRDGTLLRPDTRLSDYMVRNGDRIVHRRV